MTVRCRFAPAPSGSLHVGGARTSLFSWLFARQQGGAFVLRFEDTDAARVVPDGERIAMESLRWLGLDWDEGVDVGGPHAPYRQTERFDLYRDIAADLVARDHAYRCYCTPAELEDRRKQAMASGGTPGYDGRCRRLTEEERAAYEAEGRPSALRFAMPGEDMTVHDLVRGEAHFPGGDLKDFVILRSDGSPTYLLAAAVDDMKMEMTHVIRGEDLLSSTPRQMAVFAALGAEPPQYAHVPLIVGSDRQPLSKRHGSVAIEAFREQGIVPEALFNYLALLGWSPGEEEILPRDELVKRFQLDHIQHHPAAFDPQKLEWMNGHYLRELAPEDLAGRLEPFLPQAEPELLRRAVPLVQERMRTLVEGAELLRFLVEDVEPNDKARKEIAKAGPEHLPEAVSRLEAVEEWTTEELTAVLTRFAEDRGLSRSKAWQPIRAAVTGSTVSPPLPESMALLGRDETLRRLSRSAEMNPHGTG